MNTRSRFLAALLFLSAPGLAFAQAADPHHPEANADAEMAPPGAPAEAGPLPYAPVSPMASRPQTDQPAATTMGMMQGCMAMMPMMQAMHMGAMQGMQMNTMSMMPMMQGMQSSMMSMMPIMQGMQMNMMEMMETMQGMQSNMTEMMQTTQTMQEQMQQLQRQMGPMREGAPAAPAPGNRGPNP